MDRTARGHDSAMGMVADDETDGHGRTKSAVPLAKLEILGTSWGEEVRVEGSLSPRTAVSVDLELLDLAICGGRGGRTDDRGREQGSVPAGGEGGFGALNRVDGGPAGVVSLPADLGESPTRKRKESPNGPRSTLSAAVLQSRKRRRAEVSSSPPPPLLPPPPALLCTESTSSSAHSATSSSSSIVETTPAECFWQPSEITSHSPLDPEEDNRGVNGVGYQKTKAEAEIIALKKRRQLEAWRRREESDRRSERRLRARGRRKRSTPEPEAVEVGAMYVADPRLAESSLRRTVRFVDD